MNPLVALILVAVIIFFAGIRIVRPTHRGLVERLGKYRRFAMPGFHWLIPLIDRMYQVNITEQMVDAAPQEIITNDNLNARVDAQIYFKVREDEDSVKRSQYAVNDYALPIVNLTRTTLRNIVGTLTLKSAKSERDRINTELRKTLQGESQHWGIEIARAELKEIEPPPDVPETMNKVVKAENEKFRLYATPLKTASLWVMFDSLDGMVEGIYEVMKYDYGTGITLMGKGCYVHCLYSSRHWQEGLHFIKATGKDTNLVGMAFRGSQGRVDYERKACIRVLAGHGGIPLPDWMVAILDGHETNTTGWQQNNNMRSLGTFNGRFDSGGLFVTSGAFDTLDVLAVHMKQGLQDYREVVPAYPDYLNHPFPSFRLLTNCVQAYMTIGGHANAAGEFIFMADYARRDQLPLIGALSERFERSMHRLGCAPLSLGRDKHTWTECADHFAMAKLIKKILDPGNLLAPGAAFPADLFMEE